MTLTTINLAALGDTINLSTEVTGTLPTGNGGTSATTLAAAGLQRPNAQNIIINGSMNIWQRSTSTVTMSDGYYNVDRYRGENNVASSAATWSRSTSVPDDTGLPYSLQVDCTTADASIASGEQCGIQHTIEAQNIAGLVKYGTSDAEKITIAFWCKSNQTGQHSVSLRKLDNTNYCQPKTYTISSANTWEKKVLTFSALTSTGGAINQDNGDGLQIHWKLSAGSSYQGTADTWTQTNQGATAVSGDVNFLSSTSNDFYLTGIQLEIGEYTSSTIPPFQHESFGDNFSRCQRYYQKLGTNPALGTTSIGAGKRIATGHTGLDNNGSGIEFIFSLANALRSSPSMELNNINVRQATTNFNISSTNLYWYGTNLQVGVNADANFTLGLSGQLRFTSSDSYVAFDSEL